MLTIFCSDNSDEINHTGNSEQEEVENGSTFDMETNHAEQDNIENESEMETNYSEGKFKWFDYNIKGITHIK